VPVTQIIKRQVRANTDTCTYFVAAVTTGVSKFFSCDDFGVSELRLDGPDNRPWYSRTPAAEARADDELPAAADRPRLRLRVSDNSSATPLDKAEYLQIIQRLTCSCMFNRIQILQSWCNKIEEFPQDHDCVYQGPKIVGMNDKLPISLIVAVFKTKYSPTFHW